MLHQFKILHIINFTVKFLGGLNFKKFKNKGTKIGKLKIGKPKSMIEQNSGIKTAIKPLI